MSDLREAARFLEVLGDGDTEFVFQTFSDQKPKNGKDLNARVLVGTLEEHGELLTALNDQKVGVFVQINAGSGRGAKHITAVRELFIDLDDPNTSIDSMRAIRKYMPRPTKVVVSSDKKFHVYWRVSNCELDQFKALQKQLAITFNGDSTMSNLDRVMRVPGFNHCKGRKQLVKLQHTANLTYSVETLLQRISEAPIMTTPSVQGTPVAQAVDDAFGLNMPTGPKFEEPKELPAGGRTGKLTQWGGKLISEGYSADYVGKYLWEKTQELLPEGDEPMDRNAFENEVLGAIHKWEAKQDEVKHEMQGKKAEAAQQRAEEREAKAAPADIKPPVIIPPPPPDQAPERLEEWNSRFIFISDGSRVIDTQRRGRYGEYQLTDFRNTMANVMSGDRLMHNIWFRNANRRTVRDTVFMPTGDMYVTVQGHQMWNLYAPSEIAPVDDFDFEKIRTFVEHMEFMFPNKRDREVFWDWMAMTVQRPEIRIPWAPLIISSQGVGKGFIYFCLSKILGTHNCEQILPDRLESQFNSFMDGSVLILIDEMKHGSRYNVADKLKSYISEQTIEINEKGRKEKTRQIFCNFLIFTNHDNSTFIEEDDRRFWVHKVPSGKQSPEYYQRIWNWALEEPQSLNHLHKYLKDRDISKFRYATCPQVTEAKLRMIDSNKTELELDIVDAIEHRDDIFAADVIGYSQLKDWAAKRQDGQIVGRAEGLLRQIWGRVTHPLSVTHGIEPYGDVTAQRQRVRSIRNHDHWSNAPLEEVKYEFARSITFGLPNKDPMPPYLKRIKGDKDEANRA